MTKPTGKYQHFGQRSNTVLRFIVDFEDEHGVPPSGVDIAQGCGIARSYVFDLLTRMESEGLIERGRIVNGAQAGRPIGRNIRLTKAAMKSLESSW